MKLAHTITLFARLCLLIILLVGYGSALAKAQYSVRAVGSNHYGGLGIGEHPVLDSSHGYDSYSYSFSSKFVSVRGLADVAAIAAGGALVMKTDGTLWTWGNVLDSSLPSYYPYYIADLPVQVNVPNNFSAIAAGYGLNLALRNGTVWAWGDNYFRELGNGTTLSSAVPVRVVGPRNVTAIAAGYQFGMALTSEGTVWAWGQNDVGQTGSGATTKTTPPVLVAGLNNVIAVAAGYNHCLAVKSDGTVWAWGDNSYGGLGDGTTTNSPVPVQVLGLSQVVSVSAGYNHSLALKSDGTVWAWGPNGGGQLGNGTTAASSVPVQVAGLANAVSISAGSANSTALMTDGSLWSWGDNTYGQLGNGTTTQSTIPTRMLNTGHVRAFVSGATTYILADNPDRDFNGDAIPDIVWQNSRTGDLTVWYLTNYLLPGYYSSGYGFSRLFYLGNSDSLRQGIDTAWKVVASVDLNGDGKTDLVWQNAQTGDVTYWLMDGKNVLATDYIAHNVPTEWKIAGAGDFNGDGKTDLVWQNTKTGDATVWYMNGVSWTGNWDYIARSVPLDWQIVGTGAFYGGSGSLHQADLVWHNKTTGEVSIWAMNGAYWTGDFSLIPGVPLEWTLSGVVNTKSTLSPDLLWHNTRTGDLVVWYMGGAEWTGASDYLAKGVPLDWSPAPTH